MRWGLKFPVKYGTHRQEYYTLSAFLTDISDKSDFVFGENARFFRLAREGIMMVHILYVQNTNSFFDCKDFNYVITP